MEKKEYLEEQEGNRKSFYKKAQIITSEDENGEIISSLLSYSTIIAKYNHNKNELEVLGWFSQTTARHINSFLLYYGFDKMTKKEMITKPILEGLK